MQATEAEMGTSSGTPVNSRGEPVQTLTRADFEAHDPTARTGGIELYFLCPLPGVCAGKQSPKDGHRSVRFHSQKGVWNCKRCGATGQDPAFWKNPPGEPKPYISARVRAAKRSEAFFTAPPAPKDETLRETDRNWREDTQNSIRIDNLKARTGADYLAGRGLPAEFCASAGLTFCQNFLGMPSVIFPITDKSGETIAVQGRRIKAPTKAQEKRSSGPISGGVFASPGAFDGSFVVITEAPIDALSLYLCGVPAVATLGTENRPEWLKRACRRKIVLLAHDADTAGDTKGADGWREALRLFPVQQIKRLRPEGGKDWNAILQEKGAAWLRSWLLPRVYPYPVTVCDKPDPRLERRGKWDDFHFENWTEERRRFALEDLYRDALDFALPVERVALPCFEEGSFLYSDNPNMTAVVALVYLNGNRHNPEWLESPQGQGIRAILRRLASWWLGHPKQIYNSQLR